MGDLLLTVLLQPELETDVSDEVENFTAFTKMLEGLHVQAALTAASVDGRRFPLIKTSLVEKTPGCDWDEELDVPLAKCSRRTEALREWVTGEIRRGETAESLAQYAEAGGDSATAAKIRTIGMHLSGS